MYTLKVELYKNAVKITPYINNTFVGYEIIKLRWWQRKKALQIIKDFRNENLMVMDIKQVGWLLYVYNEKRWDFKKHTIAK